MFNFKKTEKTNKESILKKMRSIEKDLEHTVVEYQKDAIQRYPFLFLGLSTIGGVAIFHGFEQIIGRSGYLADKPLVVMIGGFLVLILTGALYKKLN